MSIKTRIYFFLFLALSSIHLSYGQPGSFDLIVKIDSTTIEARILKITNQTVNFKKTSNPDGPEFQMNKSFIAYIQFENGERLEIASEVPYTPSPLISYTSRPWVYPHFIDKLPQWPDNDLRNAKTFFNRKAKSFKTFGLLMGGMSTVPIVIGAAKISNSTHSNGYSNTSERRSDGIQLLVGGSSAFIITGMISLLKYNSYHSKSKLVQQELENRKLSFNRFSASPKFNVKQQSYGLSLRYKF